MTRVLFVSEDPPSATAAAGSGSSMISRGIITCAPADITFDLVCPGPRDALDPDCEQRCATVTCVPLRRGWTPVIGAATGWTRAAWERTPLAAVASSLSGDVTVLHGPHLVPLVRRSAPPVVVQEIDPWAAHLREYARWGGPLRRAVRLRAAARMRREERFAVRHAAAFTLVSHEDARAMQAALGRPVRAVPNGIVRTGPVLPTGPGTGTVGFLGSLDHPYNVDAALRLVRLVGDIRQRSRPDARLLLAGRRPATAVTEAAERRPWITVCADFADVRDVLSAIDVLACPRQPGFGTRNSLLEALRHGVPVVAHPTAARGIPPTGHLVHAGDEAELRERVTALLDPSTNRALRPLGDPFPRDWTVAAAEYADLYREAAGRGRGAA